MEYCRDALKRFRTRWQGKPCWACTATGHVRHHIVARDGVMERDDERNLAWLCFACHAKHHQRGLTNFYGQPVDELTTEHILRLKQVKDPDYWDLPFLQSIA